MSGCNQGVHHWPVLQHFCPSANPFAAPPLLHWGCCSARRSGQDWQTFRMQTFANGPPRSEDALEMRGPGVLDLLGIRPRRRLSGRRCPSIHGFRPCGPQPTCPCTENAFVRDGMGSHLCEEAGGLSRTASVRASMGPPKFCKRDCR